MNILTVILTIIGTIVVLLPLAYVAYVNAGSISQLRKKSVLKRMANALTCSIDADCPPGYTCNNGVCMPQQS